MLFALRDVRVISFNRLYRSILKLNVGPAERRTIRNEGATSVSVNARTCVTPSAGAMVMKSLSLFLERSFTCTTFSSHAPITTTIEILTLSRLAVLGSITLRTSRTSCVSDVPTLPCLITNDFGTPSAVPGAEATPPLRCVRFFRLRAIMSVWRSRYLRRSVWSALLIFAKILALTPLWWRVWLERRDSPHAGIPDAACAPHLKLLPLAVQAARCVCACRGG